ncbi:hypothetical protein GCM10022227_19200 [Streptomyces sedi]
MPEAALALLDAELARVGRVRTGEAETVRHWSISLVLRAPTDGGPVWFKAVPPAFAHEGRVASWVESVRPAHSPSVLSHGNGWLLTREIAGAGTEPWSHALEAAARIQVASIGRTDELVRLGCPRREGALLRAGLVRLAERPELLASAERRQLAEALPRIAELLSAVEQDDVPPVLVHADIQRDNVCWDGNGWVVIDWTDAVVAHPFAELARPTMNATPRDRALAEAAFSKVWAKILPLPTLAEALRLAPVLGASVQVLNYADIVHRIGGAQGFSDLLRLWVERLLDATSATTLLTPRI